MNWLNCQSKVGDLPLTPIWNTVGVIHFYSGFTLHSRRFIGSLCPKTSGCTTNDLEQVLSREFSELVICTLSSKPRGARTPFVTQDTMASAGLHHTVLLRSDGQAVACGSNYDGQCSIPPLDEGISYSQVSAGFDYTVLLRSDGQAVAHGLHWRGQCRIPPLDEGLSYSQVSAGDSHTVLLRSDGQAVTCGWNSDGRCNIPPLDEGLSYSQVSAGGSHTVLLRSDGQAVACGENDERQCSIPLLDEGLSYSQVSGGGWHTVLLRSDGQAVACGFISHGQCNIPPLDEGLSKGTSRFLQDCITQCFSEVMVKLLLAVKMILGSAAFHPWMQEFHTARFLQDVSTQCFSEVMVKLLLAAQIVTANATFHHWGLGVTGCGLASHLRAIATFVIPHLPWWGKTVWCKWIFSLRVIQVLYWLVLDWMGWRCCDWRHKILTEQWMFAAAWLVNWTQTLRIFEWFCLMHACLVQSARRIHLQYFRMWFQSKPEWQAECGFDGRKKCEKEGIGIPSPCHPIGLGKFAWTCRVVEQCWLSPHHITPTWV